MMGPSMSKKMQRGFVYILVGLLTTGVSDMFSNSKYTDWYYSIIENAKTQERKKSKGNYFEAHHIIPHSLGGTKSKDNIVLLTAREHFICHVLLTKMTSGKDKMRMSYAVYRLCTPKSIKHADRYSSKTYEKFRESLSKNISGANSCHYGVPKSEVTKSRIRETRQAKGYTTPEKNGMYKRNHTTEAKQKMSETKKTNNFGQTQKFIDANPNKKRITDGTTIYASVREASRLIPIHRNVINRLLREGTMWYC